MKAIKIILSVVVALIVVIAIVVVVGLQNLNSLVEMGIESVGPQVTKTDVQVERVDIELTEGRGSIYGLDVANPEGFSDNPILQVGEVTLQIQPSSLTEDVTVIRAIVVDGARLNAEHRGLADINMRDMLDNIQPDGPEEPTKPTTASPDMRFMVEELQFTNAALNLHSEEFGERELAMQDIQLSDLGDREQGLTPAQLGRAILSPIVDQARRRLEQELKDEAGGQLQEELEERLSDEEKEDVDRVKSLLGR